MYCTVALPREIPEVWFRVHRPTGSPIVLSVLDSFPRERGYLLPSNTRQGLHLLKLTDIWGSYIGSYIFPVENPGFGLSPCFRHSSISVQG